MRYVISMDPDAEVDLFKIADWYDIQSYGLGDRFVNQISLQIDTLEANPKLHAIRRGKTRAMAVKGFPFFVLFTISDSEKIVRINNILHISTNRDSWPRT